MRVPQYHSHLEQDRVTAPEDQQWVLDALEPRDAQLAQLTDALSNRLDFSSNFNASILEFKAAHNTTYAISTQTVRGSIVGVLPLYNEHYDHCQIAWQPYNTTQIQVTPYFRTAPSGEALLRILLIGGA